VLPFKVVQQVVSTLEDIDIVIPDNGASSRVMSLTGAGTGLTGHYIHQCYKKRDPQTGALSGFQVPMSGLKGRDLLIIDDLCDGGGTFVGLAKALKAHVASKVFLFVTHGIFSKGLPLEGIDHVYTTDSYDAAPEGRSKTFRSFDMQQATVISISMEKL
jgi:ribose-phosphate pyrophosphokinase